MWSPIPNKNKDLLAASREEPAQRVRDNRYGNVTAASPFPFKAHCIGDTAISGVKTSRRFPEHSSVQ